MTAREILNGRVDRTKSKIVSCSNRKKICNIQSLPEEIIFSILVWLPADILYNSMRYVCHKWYNIIHDPIFAKEHLLRSSAGLLIIDCQDRPATFGGMNLRVTEVFDTCDGLILFEDNYDSTAVHVANPLTKQRVTVPTLRHSSSAKSFSLAYSRMEYKVVCTYSSNAGKVFDCALVILGKDHAWKPINCQKLSDHCRTIFTGGDTISTGEFIYWVHQSYPYIVALDVESEMFYEFSCPSINIHPIYFHYFKKGKSLSCVSEFDTENLWDVWVLSDSMTGEWRKLHKIEVDAQKYRLERFPIFIPAAWVSRGDVMIFFLLNELGLCVAVNAETGKTLRFKSSCNLNCSYVCDFAYSLVSFTGGS